MSITVVDQSWQASANCATADPDLFHPDGVGGAITTQQAAALRVCQNCEVRAECLAWALDTRQTEGVWGGTTGRQRYAMLRRQVDRCLNAQAWIEAEVEEGRALALIAAELGVDKTVMNRAVREFGFRRYLAGVKAEGATA